MQSGNKPNIDYKDNTQISDYIKITKVIGYKANSSAPIVPVLETGTLTKGAGVNGNN